MGQPPNGNLKNDSFHTYAWDANWGNPSTIDSTTLTYDALGRMVEYQNGATTKQVMYGPTGKVAIMNGQTEITSLQPFPAGGVFVHRPGSLTNYWRHPDWLGSSRFASTEPGRAKFFDVGYAPFGEDYGDSGTKDLFFTGQEQDTTTSVGGLYDFMFREYAPRQGRWISADPAGLSAVSLSDPQTWNRYSYVRNSSLSNVDQLGLQCSNGTSGPSQGGAVDCPDVSTDNTFTFRATVTAPMNSIDLPLNWNGSFVVGRAEHYSALRMHYEHFQVRRPRPTKTAEIDISPTSQAAIQKIAGTLSLITPPDPDYLNLSFGAGEWSGNVQYIPSTGNWFVTPLQGSVGTPWTLSLTAGYLDDPAHQDVENFVNQWGASACAFAGPGACETYSPGAGFATEFGFGIPSASVSGGFTLKVNPSPNSSDPVLIP